MGICFNPACFEETKVMTNNMLGGFRVTSVSWLANCTNLICTMVFYVLFLKRGYGFKDHFVITKMIFKKLSI